MQTGRPVAKRLAVAGLLLAWCAALIAYRAHLSFDSLPKWLAGNLLLASVPLVCSTAMGSRFARRCTPVAAGLFGLWLLFLPNAPYIVTDLIHLTHRSIVPLWFSVALLASCAITGLLLGYLSLIDVHVLVDRRFGTRAGWAVASGSLLLSGFGIYLGRFLRWNSWNLFTDPLRLAREFVTAFANGGDHSGPISVTMVYGVGLLIGYIAIRLIGSPDRPVASMAGGPAA